MSESESSAFLVTIADAEGRASTTASARSEMNDEVHPRAGTLPQFSMPDSKAKCLYSMSISSKVSMCSLTKLIYNECVMNRGNYDFIRVVRKNIYAKLKQDNVDWLME